MKELSFGEKRICVLSEEERVLSKESLKSISEYIIDMFTDVVMRKIEDYDVKLKKEMRAVLIDAVKELREKEYSLDEIADMIGFKDDGVSRTHIERTRINRTNI